MKLLLKLVVITGLLLFGYSLLAQEPVSALVPQGSSSRELKQSSRDRVRVPQEAVLVSYLHHAQQQLTDLGAYSDDMQIEAYLPSSSQRGKFQLRRSFHAPGSMAYQPLRFEGDGFVKSNVIYRVLRADAEHVKKGERGSTAMTAANYKFSYKGTRVLEGRQAYVYELRPRKKRAGLFKGRIYVDAYSASLLRAEGTMVKSPSFFIKRIEFLQDYTSVGGFDMPAKLHSVTTTRVIGPAVVDIVHMDYCTRSLSAPQGVCAGGVLVAEIATASASEHN